MIRWTCNNCGFSGMYSGNPGQEIHCRNCRASAIIKRPRFTGELIVAQAGSSNGGAQRQSLTGRLSRMPRMIVFGAPAVLLLPVLFFLWPSISREGIISDPTTKQVAEAVGLLVPTLEVTLPAGKTVALPIGTGTCFLITPKGTALTNAHVVQEAYEFSTAPLRQALEEELTVRLEICFWVFLKGEQIRANVVAINEEHDMAILRVKQEAAMPYFQLGDAAKLDRGTNLIVLGFPYSPRQPMLSDEKESREFVGEAAARKSATRLIEHFSARDLEYVLTKGAVTRLARDGTKLLVEHDATTGFGSSGGPVLTEDGRVVAVTFAKEIGAANMGHAIAVESVKDWIQKHVPESTW